MSIGIIVPIVEVRVCFFSPEFVTLNKTDSMNDLTLKYNLLDSSSKKEVIDFIHFLLEKKAKSNKPESADYKKRILNVSVWSESDIVQITRNQQKLNQWKAQEW